MPSRVSRLIASIIPLVIVSRPLHGQIAGRVDAGGGAGGSVFGWTPRVSVAGEQAVSLGALALSWHGSLDRVSATKPSRYALLTGARLARGTALTGWWLGAEAIRRNAFADVVEQPRIESGGWRRIGNVVVSISASRRAASMAGMSRFTRTVTSYFAYQDTITGQWDSISVSRQVTDSARANARRRWAETEAGLAWEGRRLSAALALGGRVSSRDVPAGVWGSANVALRLSSPLSLVVGAATTSHSRFALDGEHRYVTLGLRISPRLAPALLAERAVLPGASMHGFAVEPLGMGRYRLTITAGRARRVELSGDFTSWKPMTLTSNGDGRWMATLALSPGPHRLNARIDGGSWIVPPGLTTMSDDFAGEVGLLVIEQRPEDAAK